MIKSFILGKNENNNSYVYLWNVIGGMLNAGQSAILLIAISRTVASEDSGVYSLAYAIASLALTIGLFGIRHFQASDVDEKYSFSVYQSTRIVSSIFMLMLITFYVVKGAIWNNYSFHKCVVIVLTGLLKLIDVIEDVYHGRLQQKRKLEIAAKSITIRYILMLSVMLVVLFVLKNLVISLVSGLFISCVVFLWTLWIYFSNLEWEEKKKGIIINKDTWRLLLDCLVVATGNFFMIYLANAPKYAIDKYMNDVYQSHFNYIFMPIYVVSTLCLYIFQPSITQMAKQLERKELKLFWKTVWKQLLIISGINVLVFVLGFFVGIPTLGFFYHTDLSMYKTEFMILLLSGSVLSFSTFISVCIIVIRKQKLLLAGYIIPAVISLFISNMIVYRYSILGASLLYFIAVTIQLIIFLLTLIFGYNLFLGEMKNERMEK